MDMKKINLTPELLIEFFGKPQKQYGAEYMWQCPYCQDSHMDNLKYNETKNVLWCFADQTHGPKVLKNICEEINKKQKNNSQILSTKNKNISEPQNISIMQDEFTKKTYSANLNLLNQKEKLNFLYKKRGLTIDTVKRVKIGIDANGTWRIPTFKYSTDPKLTVVGFEYRPRDLSKNGLFREKGTLSCLANINEYGEKTEAIVVVEGYFDGYVLLQFLTEKGQDKYYHITTPSNGVNSLFKFVSKIEFDKYKKFYLFLDNDKAGIKMTKDIIEKYPMFKPIILPCGCKDFNQHYLECLRANT